MSWRTRKEITASVEFEAFLQAVLARPSTLWGSEREAFECMIIRRELEILHQLSIIYESNGLALSILTAELVMLRNAWERQS